MSIIAFGLSCYGIAIVTAVTHVLPVPLIYEMVMQILADVLNTKVEQLESGAGAGYGIALCAAAAGDENLSMNDLIEQTVSIKNTFIPRQYNRELYEQKNQKYLRVYDALKHIYQE